LTAHQAKQRRQSDANGAKTPDGEHEPKYQADDCVGQFAKQPGRRSEQHKADYAGCDRNRT
jgi:hypothetical protein